MRSTFGKNIQVSIWGGSHEPAIGVDIRGLPLGTIIDMEELAAFLKRRAPGSSPFATKRKEPDVPVPVRGLAAVSAASAVSAADAVSTAEATGPVNAANAAVITAAGVNTGSLEAAGIAGIAGEASGEGRFMTVTEEIVSLEIRNTDTRSADYKALRAVPRPGHADYTARLRYGDELNMAGGGPFSARMTAPLCIAGGIAMQILKKLGITIGAHIGSVADISDMPFDPIAVDAELMERLKTKDFAAIDDAAAKDMQARITEARMALDSVGGVVEVCAVGLPGGIGGAMYDGVESALAPIFFGIPAVKGVEFGAGFGAARLRGSENNDPFYYPQPDDPLYCMQGGGGSGCQYAEGAESGKHTGSGGNGASLVRTRTNNHGGILGGITTGMPLIARLAFKPTPSISAEQDSVDLDKKENTKLIIKGRHDPCVVVRAVPIAEAALALGLLDCIMDRQRPEETPGPAEGRK